MGNSRGTARGAASGTAREDPGSGADAPAPSSRTSAANAGERGGPGPRSAAGRGRGSSAGPGSAVRPCSGRRQDGASDVVKNSASGSLSRDSDRSAAGSTKSPETPMNGSASGLSSSKKRRKKQNARSYWKRFKKVEGADAADAVDASPDRVGKENTSSGHVADSNISKLCEGSRLAEKNKRNSSESACKVSKSPVLGLHETSETRVKQCSAPFSEVQPCKPTAVCRQNIAAESSLPVKARDRPTAPARQSCLSSLQSVPISLNHHEEIKSTLGDREPISVQKEDSASGHVKVMPSETDGNSNICISCRTPGALRSCDGKGCQSRYHISCLDPSLEYFSPGLWFCTSCTKKRFQFGLHSIVEGIESVWDVKEAEGMQNSKQYFVKYKNLAHVHNRWVPEGDISVMPGGPDLLSLFNQRNRTEKAIWKEEWTKPHRLLRKRLLMPHKLADDFFSSSGDNYLYCNLEWLVKWKGLGYDHATWELETLPCLCTPEADELKRNYENRREAAKQSSIPTKAKVKQSSFQKLQRLPDGCHPDFDNDHLCSINHLREFWYKSCGAVLVDDKEFIIKTILFTMSVLPDVSQPILIVTTPASLSLWEVQFNNLAPFINVVVYDGGKDKLKLIQDLEFYESGSSVMLQVLLSHADAILEDIKPISHIDWEAVIVDYYQKSTLQYLEQLKQLSTDFRMLLVSSPIKDNLPEYTKLLGFLKSGEQENGNRVDTADALVMSKLNFKQHIAYERRADSSKILEHWVPAYISQLQLEIYCSILLSNSSVLQSKMKSDSSLCDIIMSLSKCCDHPYLVDEFLQHSTVDNHGRTDTLDTRVQACGKLLLLQKMLKEIRNKRLRVIILFQSSVAGGNSMGDILEGVVCERFGPESYERVESGAPLTRKHAAVNMFNDKTKGRFVFLIESRACLPSIKLLSVDAFIIYNSDCNPLHDLKALQKIKIEPQLKYPGIFRLYTPFTMEEKQLVLAKHGVPIDNYKDMTHSSGHSLISWGASILFTRLDELHRDNYASKNFERDTQFMDEVKLEFLKRLAMNVEDSTEIYCAHISKANMSGEFYSRSITLIGEKVAMPALDGDPSNFWLNLLDGKFPCRSNVSEPPQSSHRMSQNIEEPAKVPAEEADEARRKRRKVDRITVPSSRHSSDNSHDDMLPKNCTILSPPLQQLDDTQQKEGVKKLMSTPKNLHVQLELELSKLIKVLQLPDNVRLMAEQFFEDFLNNHLVLLEPVGILHAFNIALCWRVASLLKYKVDHRESLALAEKSFNCEYNEALAESFYTKLRTLKLKVPNRAGETSIKGQPVSLEDTQFSWQETSTNLENDHMFQNKEMDLHDNFTNGTPQEVSSVPQQMISEGQEPVQETRKECHLPNDEPPNMIVEKSIDLVDNVFSLRENKILCKQQLEISGLVTHRQNNVTRLKDVCSLVLEHIRRSHTDEITKSEKIKLTAQWFTMLMYAFLEHMKLQHDKLEGLQSDTWSSERQLKEKLHQVAKSGQLDWDFDLQIALPDSNFIMEEFIHFKEQTGEYHIAESSVSDCQQSSNDALSIEITLARSEALSEPISIQAMEIEPVETSVGSGGGPASEAVDLPENSIHCSSDDIGVQRAGCSSSTIPANDDSTGQESSTSGCRNTEHNIAKPSMLLGGATSLVRGVNENNDDTLDTDGVHLESPNLASSQSLKALVGTQAVLSSISPQQSTDLSAQQNVAPPLCPPVEAEQTGLLGAHAVQVLQPEMQPSILFSDAPSQKTHPNDRVQAGCQPDKATGLSQGGAATSHHLGDARIQVQKIYDGNAAADPVFPESIAYPADSPVTLQVSTEVESQICEPSMATKQSTSPPAQQSMAISRYPPAEAEQPGILGTEAASDLQTEVQPSILMQDQPTEAEQAGTLGSIVAQDLQPEMQSLTSTQDVPFERTYLSGMPVLQSPAVLHCVGPSPGLESAGIVIAHDLQSKIQPSASVLAEQSTSLPAQQRLATSQHRPAEAEPTGILGTETTCVLQPKMQPSTSMQDKPAEAERAGTLAALESRDLQPEMQSSTSTQDVSFERTYLSGMPVVQSPTIHQVVEPSLDLHAGVEPVGMVTAHDLQSEIQPSASVPAEQGTSLPAQQNLATSQHPSAEAKPTSFLGTKPVACDLQPEVKTSTSVLDEPAEAKDESEAEDEPELPEVDDEPEVPEAEDEPEIEDEPAEAEQAGTLGAIASQDLQPEMQLSTSTQVVPFEQTYLSSMSAPRSLTIHRSVEPSLDPHAGVESASMVTARDLHSELPPSALVPTEQSTSLPAQQSLATSRHSPADILGTEAACDLLPLQGEVQPSTTMHDQPAAARSLQPETQPSTSTYLVGMPVLQSHSVEPSLDPHARAESTHTAGSLIAHDLLSEVQPSASIHDRPAEAEGAVMLGSTAAQELQPELQSSTTVQHVPLERIHCEERRQIGFQPNMVPGPEQPTQRPPVTTLVFNNPIVSAEPLKNELDRLMHCNNVLSKDHEHKKSLLLIEYNQEIEKITKKYDSLLQKEDSTYLQTQRELTDLYRKVFVNKALADNFGGVFTPSSAAQGRSTSPVMEQPFVSSSAAQTAASPVISSSGIRPPVYNPPGSYVRPSYVAQPSSSSSSWNAQPQTTQPGNLYGTTSSPFVPAPVPHGSYGSAGAQPRAVQPQSALPSNLYRPVSPVPLPHLPHGSYRSAGEQLRASAPHLQQHRMPSPYAIHTDQQQQLHANPGVTWLGQQHPVIMGLSTIPQGVPVLNSVDLSSAHQTMLPSASSSRPPRRASSLPSSGRHPESMLNLQSSTSNPIFMPAQQQSSYPNMVNLLNAAPGSQQQHGGAQAASVSHNQSGFESASPNAYMPARFGLGSSSSAGAASAADVVCLSDDE